MLYTNNTLRKLELEGNLMGPKSATEMGKVLKVNKGLVALDLGSNQLTMDGQEMHGIYELAESLKSNETLLSLNLSNNQMDQKCGELFREALQVNQSLIDFDYSNNKYISLEDSRAIQESLRRNKAAYDAERLKEWKERKGMRTEDEGLKKVYLEQQAAKEQSRMEEEGREVQEEELNAKWKKFMLETEIEK